MTWAMCQQVRPPAVLQRVVAHLLDRVCRLDDVSVMDRIAFVSGRLRAVRQDLVVQRVGDSVGMGMLEDMVDFLVASWFRVTQVPPRTTMPAEQHSHYGW